MTKEINEIQQKLGEMFHSMIPVPYKRACMFYRGGPDVETDFRFCFVDEKTGKLIPDDHICERNDITIEDPAAFGDMKNDLIEKAKELQNKYLEQLGNQWYVMTFDIKENGKFSATFSHQPPEGSMQAVVNRWCIKNIGTLPEVTADDLRS